MKVEQISIFIENKSGRLAEVTGILGEAGINIRALSLADTSDFGILRLIIKDPEKALQVLREHNFTVSKTDVIGVEVPDKPGGLSSILKILDKNNVNVEYMYAFVERSGDNAVIIFRFDNIDEAISALTRNGVKILKGEQITSI
ncbi:MAG: ACT domain-containing protein [Desulfuromonadales bacterium]|nr:ACT domain-containing protein [Chloroflexota bacterium]MCK4621212.1 ACT domain-containing protein [Desulfuromonadales bacterium]MCK4691949.1 ACT domain-containing protein [Desulfuromonadales bacterium]NOQ50990.1 ACT domain-containing protein [Desulfuromonadaceae bacterium]